MRKEILGILLALSLFMFIFPMGTMAEDAAPGSADIMPMVFVTGTIPADMFEINGLPENVTADAFLANWSYTADGKPIDQVPMRPDGTRPTSRFPEYPGYHFVNVTVGNVEARQLGILQLSEFLGPSGIQYYYLTQTSGNAYETSSTVLEDGQKFIINYALDEFDITYEVKMADGSSLPDGVTLDSTFGPGRPVVTANHAYSFDVRIPYGYTASVYRYSTDANGAQQRTDLISERNAPYPLGTEPVYVQVDSSNVKVDETQGPKTMLVNDTFYNNNVTENRHIVVELTKSAAPKFNASQWLHTVYAGGGRSGRGGTAEEGFVWEDYYAKGNHADIKPEDNYSWGSLYDGPKDMTKNVDGTYDYSWTFQTSTGAGADGFFLDTMEINGQDIVVPFFPRVTDPDGDLVGFNPENGRAVGEVEGKSYTVTTLPDGTKVRLDYLYVFNGSNSCNQRVYRLTVTGAACNVTISGGNLMMYGDGAHEFVTYSLVGVHADGEETPDNRTAQSPAIQAYWPGSGWKDHPMSNVLVSFPYAGDADRWGATIRFKLADGYSNPWYSFESTRNGIINGTDKNPQSSITRDSEGNITSQNEVLPLPAAGGNMDSQHIYGPDADDWYYIKVTTQGQNNPAGSSDYHKMALLYIAATPTKYVVRYLPGEVQSPADGTMPEFDPSASGWETVGNRKQYDDNGGRYYDVVANSTITVDGRVPIDPEQQSAITGKVFQYWTLVGTERNADGTYKPLDETIRIYPGQALLLEDKLSELVSEGGYAFPNSELGEGSVDVCVLRLQAVWAPTPDPFHYTVWLEYIDELGERHRVQVPADIVHTENDYGTGGELIIGVNLDAPVFVEWLKEHPYYHFSSENQDVHKVGNNGEIVITLEPVNGALLLEKHVEGDSEGNDIFTFTISGPGYLNENFLAWPADIPIDERTADDMIVVHFVNGNAQVQLRHGQRIVLYVPPGNYAITEAAIPNADLRVKIDGTYVKTGEPAQTSRTVELGKDSAPAVFTNIFNEKPGGLTVTKTVTGNAGDQTQLFHFVVALSDTSVNGSYPDEDGMLFENGVAEFDLKHGDSLTASGLLAGITYTVTETDSQGYAVTVTGSITENGGQGTITANAIDSVVFTNRKVNAAALSLNGAKTLTGHDLTANQFAFTVEPADDNPADDPISALQTVTNAADGSIPLFANVQYPHPGVYNYTIRETDQKEPGYHYDTTYYTVTVTVSETDNGNALSASASITKHGENSGADGQIVFVNTYDADSVSVTLRGTKTFENGTLSGDDFSFELTRVSPQDAPLPAETIVTNAADGKFSFGSILYTAEGVYEYQIREIGGSDANVRYDGTVYTVIVTVNDIGGMLTANVTYNGSDSVNGAEFTNTHKQGNLSVSKMVKGSAGETDRPFNFTVILDDIRINGMYGEMYFVNGSAAFTLKHGESKTASGLPAGVRYTVIERAANLDGYETSAVGDTGIITDEQSASAIFVNFKEEVPDIPETGDTNHPGFWLALMVVSLLGLAMSAFMDKRKARSKQ